jgi:putative FmdB family regulatory protein
MLKVCVMPIYEYQCVSCGHRLEAFQKMTEAPLTDCPTCQKPDLQKLVSAAGFQLKGTGWYATDFRNKNKKTSDTKEEVNKASTDTKEDASKTSTESKADTPSNTDSTGSNGAATSS